MNTCKRCKNNLRPSYHEVYIGMGEYKRKLDGGHECPYCIWKGDEGPGKLLKEIVKEINKKVRE